MARQLTTSDSKMSLYDRLSNSDLVLYYRVPTPQEQIDYDNSQVTRTRNKIKSASGDVRMKFGAQILTGIGDDSFTVPETDENALLKMKPLHSRKDSEYYDPEWKNLVVTMAPDIISKFAFLIFEASVEQSEDGDTVEDPT